MATFTRPIPTIEQTGVARTTLVGFTILNDSYGVQIGTLSTSVNGVQVISGGVFVNGYAGSVFSGTGKYVVGIYPKGPSYLPAASSINVDASVLDSYNTLDSYSWTFYTAGFVPPIPPPAPTTGRACLSGKPFFLSNNVGLQLAKDDGVGTEATLTWNEAAPYNEIDFVAYNIYIATKRVDVFGNPRFIVTAQQAVIGGLTPADTQFFGVRATEIVSTVSLSGLRQVGPNMYIYPQAVLDGYLTAVATSVPVDSTDGFPSFGILEIGTELVRYLSIQVFPPAFITDITGRGYLGTLAQVHVSGTSVLFWRGDEDGNTIIAQTTPSFQKPNYALTYVLGDGYGPDGYRDGYDGYNVLGDGYFFPQQIKFDDITTDTDGNDALADFPRLDYCGTYRRLAPADFWKGQCVGSYFGGVQLRDGHLVRANNVQDQMLQREELLLETTGEPFVLLRRLWTGIRCACFMFRREHPDERCPVCYATGFVGGYQQFFNPRRPDARILVRVDPAVEDLKIGDKDGLSPDYKPGSWTMAFPAVKDRDVLIRFNEDNTEDARFEILDVTRVRGFFGQSGVQKFNMQRFHKTDIIYQLSAQRDMSPHSITLTTGVSSGPGIPAHLHTFPIPDGGQLSSINGMTSVNERHSHIVRQGKVLVVLGHTHTLTS